MLALLMMAWRWGGTAEDSQADFDTARLLVPALAGIIPRSSLLRLVLPPKKSVKKSPLLKAGLNPILF